MPLNDNHIWHLRGLPGHDAESVMPRSRHVRLIGERLVELGFAEVNEQGRHRRTIAGDEALRAFDDTLSNSAREILVGLLQGQQPNHRGVLRLCSIGLVQQDDDGVWSLKPEGEKVVQRWLVTAEG